jgi:hypothetical protein
MSFFDEKYKGKILPLGTVVLVCIRQRLGRVVEHVYHDLRTRWEVKKNMPDGH